MDKATPLSLKWTMSITKDKSCNHLYATHKVRPAPEQGAKDQLQPNQINMAVLFWYLVNSNFSSVRYWTRVYLTSHFSQGTGKTRPETLVTLHYSGSLHFTCLYNVCTISYYECKNSIVPTLHCTALFD